MAKFNGFPGMNGGNFNNILKQAQKMQQEVLKKQEEVAAKEFEASVGGGAVTVKVTGDKIVKEVIIKKEVVDPDDVEMLQDLIVTAMNEALRQVDAKMNSEMQQYNIPGLF
ncbi:MAG: YbaB/EbfC family nucleoid-associated protein [Clostridiales bacterium]|nr:YbaB/EbfC family nucleoid-associated protein [Clostridiales bacterium]